MSDRSVPLVGIGLPVYNGERYLKTCLESVVNQTFGDFQLFISDDGSRDGSEEICRDFAAHDSRIHFHRHPSNVGMVPNMHTVFGFSNNPYFKWLGHDDRLEPDFLEASLAALSARPDAVLCYSAVDVIDGHGIPRVHVDGRLPDAEGSDPVARFAQVALTVHGADAFHGVHRADAIRRCLPFRLCADWDWGALAGLALQGPFVYVPRPLFQIRDHDDRYVRKLLYNREKVTRAIGAKRATRFSLHRWMQFFDYAQRIAASPLGVGERLRCYGHLLRWCGQKRNYVSMALDLIALLDPRIERALRQAKHNLLDPHPTAS